MDQMTQAERDKIKKQKEKGITDGDFIMINMEPLWQSEGMIGEYIDF